MKVLITGANGQLGRALTQVFDKTHQIIGIDKADLNITNTNKVQCFINKLDPDLIIHSAAITDVDGCEERPRLAYKINAFGTQNLAVACKQVAAKFVYIGTDFVFNGEKGEPYIEFDKPAPLNVYGKSKLTGEEYIKNLLDKYYIVRTSWLYGAGDNFVKTMLKLATKREYLEIVDDQIGTPTFTYDLAQAIFKLIRSNLYGTYHISNKGSCSWYQFAQKIFEIKEIDIEVKSINSAELDRPANRPAYSVLCNFALENQGMYVMRRWENALKKYLQTL